MADFISHLSLRLTIHMTMTVCSSGPGFEINRKGLSDWPPNFNLNNNNSDIIFVFRWFISASVSFDYFILGSESDAEVKVPLSGEMRARSQSGVRLDQLMVVVQKTILFSQDPVTGLFVSNPERYPSHAWIRDNVYAVQAVWAMHRAYQKRAEFDEDLVKAHELGLNCVKCMQSLLECMLRQADKVELFKRHQRKSDCLHAKYSAKNKATVIGDNDWGHLQIDAVSIFLLILAQMTASGLQIVRNFDEVAFVQNLVYYIETGYRTPDFGTWERGDKTNQGIRELNASSIGMAKAALQAINDVGDLFGDGSKGSIIHVLPDEIQQCSAVLCNMLPRESFSKETDAALLSIISFPAFAVDDSSLATLTRETILATLGGRYGCKRFLRDGYKTALEDSTRLHYINSELQKFENIECEWPLFLCNLYIDAVYRKDETAVNALWKQLQTIMIPDSRESRLNFVQLVPELFKVPADKVEMERLKHGSQNRIPGGTIPFLWAQSLYVLCCLLHDRYLTPAELDPLSRRLLATEKRPPCEVQVVVLAEDRTVKEQLTHNDIDVQMVSELESKYAVLPASILAKILQRVGQSTKLNLSGRPADRDVQLLSTSRLYHVGSKLVAFTPQFMDVRRSHLVYDIRVLMDEWSSELYYIYTSWNSVSISGRPLVVLVISNNMLQTNSIMDDDTSRSFITDVTQKSQKSTVLGALKKIKNGYIGGARVVMGDISDFSSTTSVSKLEFQDGTVEEFFSIDVGALPRSLPREKPYESGTPRGPLKRSDSVRGRWFKQFNTVQAASMRHRSIVLDSNDADLLKLRLANAAAKKIMKPTVEEEATQPQTHLLSSYPDSIGDNNKERLQHSQLEEMEVSDLITMLAETTLLDEQASIIHFLWLKLGPNFDTKLGSSTGVSVRLLIEEVYIKACESRDWSWARLAAGLLGKQLDELEKAVTHLLVRQKQITVGMPSKNEEAITSPKNKEELRQIFNRCYSEDPNSLILAQELIVSLGSLVRTDPKLFLEMFRLRISLIIQVLASELARLRHVNAETASQQLLSVSPFELKCMLLSLLSGRLLEESGGPGTENEFGVKELRTGIGSFRKQIEERKSMRERAKSMRVQRSNENLSEKKTPKLVPSAKLSLASLTAPVVANVDDSPSDSEDSLAGEEFQFGIWLRHRRIDGALNRVPPDFYANLWETVRVFSHGLSIDGIVLSYGLTQEMTRKEIKFALQVEQVLNQIAEPEYREMIVEVLTLMGKLKLLIVADPRIPGDRSFEIEFVLQHANRIFVDHNVEMGTIVLECCGSGICCDGARGICKHFYDTAPAGEFGTAHYIIRAAMDIFSPS